MNDLAILERLRKIFLSDAPGARFDDYWDKPATLGAYDRTYARRIGWKWDAVLATARERGLVLPPRDDRRNLTLVDWGCGTGVATRRFLASFGAAELGAVRVFDRSRAAMQFALDATLRECPDVRNAGRFDPAQAWPSPYLLLLSHVVNELDESAFQKLSEVARAADVVFLVEPGTPAHAARVRALRETLQADFHFLAPCRHQETCGMAAAERLGDWCHFFAPPAADAFHDPEWSKLARQIGIDLRSLPVSYLVAVSKAVLPRYLPTFAASTAPEGLVLGRARIYKGYAQVQSCQPEGIVERRVQKRDDGETFKALRNGGFKIVLPQANEGLPTVSEPGTLEK